MTNQIARVINALCDDVATPLSAEVKLLFGQGEFLKLQQLQVVPSVYTDPEDYWRDAMVVDLLRKCKLPSGVDTAAVARATFISCEAENARTNARLSRYLPESLLIEDALDERVFCFISSWRKEVSYVLGNLPSNITTRFSGGATYGDTGLYTTTPDKMSNAPQITEQARCLLPFWHETSWCRSLERDRPWYSDPVTVRGNVFFTVPKDGKTDRGCCKEPSINIGFQLDAGRVIRTRLRRIDIDITGTNSWNKGYPAYDAVRQSDSNPLHLGGQYLHRHLARVGSQYGGLATIDMSNASDTLCRVLPKLILEDGWWELLNSLRSVRTRVAGKWFRLEKFSSMGNGFTFELETLVFATLARTVITLAGGDSSLVRCYGDDLIVPSEHVNDVMAALKLFGFTPNTKKTFLEGPFRESCGGDYFSGVPVRAHFLKVLPDEPQQWIALANGLRRVACTDGAPPSRWGIVVRAWLRALDPIPSDIRRCRGPSDLGDVVIHDAPEFWSTAPDSVMKKKVPGWDPTWSLTLVRGYSPITPTVTWDHWIPSVQLACCTLGYESTGVKPRSSSQTCVGGYQLKWIPLVHNKWLPPARALR